MRVVVNFVDCIQIKSLVKKDIEKTREKERCQK